MMQTTRTFTLAILGAFLVLGIQSGVVARADGGNATAQTVAV